MKQAQLPNPSRAEVLAWVNSLVQTSIGPVNKIEDLGTGAAYLFLFAITRPGSVKVQRIIKNPSNLQECLYNFKQVTALLEKFDLPYTIEPNKLAQMKYQDNFYFASFLYRALTQPSPEPNTNTSSNENLNPNNKPRRIKITPPQKKVEMKVTKEAPPEVTAEDLQALQPGSQRKLKEIEAVLEDSQSNKAKLQKIAAILNLSVNKKESHTVATNTTQEMNPPPAISIEASYKRFLRPSLCEKSEFLSKPTVPMSFEKTKDQENKPITPFDRKPIPMNEILPEAEFEGEMLLSQRKQVAEERDRQGGEREEGEKRDDLC